MGVSMHNRLIWQIDLWRVRGIASKSSLLRDRRRAGCRPWVPLAIAAGLLCVTAPSLAQLKGDVEAALAALPDAAVVARAAEGVPTWMTGDLGRVGSVPIGTLQEAEAALAAAIGPALVPLRLKASDIRLQKISVGPGGERHFRYRQFADGLEVVGGDLVLHVDHKGTLHALNGGARGDLPRDGSGDLAPTVLLQRVSRDPRVQGLSVANVRRVYLITPIGDRHRAVEFEMTGFRGRNPARDDVYVDAVSGQIVAVHPQVHFAESRAVYSANNGTILPGTLRRAEGSAAMGDTAVDSAYDNTGAFYEAFNGFWGRDSYDGLGATLKTSVHYYTDYCNGFWDGTQLVFGDGDTAVGCNPPALAIDYTAHELMHAVTDRESMLNYSGESGAINESMSDIFGAFVEAWVHGGRNGTLATSSSTWLFGEDVVPPYLRNLGDPASDGTSADFYSSSVGSLDVHYASGVGNLAFYLLSQGGSHPRGKSSVTVNGIGMEKAIRIFYEANIDFLTSNSDYAGLQAATLQASQTLGYDPSITDSVNCAFAAVGILGANPSPDSCAALVSEISAAGLSSATPGEFKYWTVPVTQGQRLDVALSGGTGNADLYVRAGSAPTTSTYDCALTYLGNDWHTCTIPSAPADATYWIGVETAAAYTGVSMTATVTDAVTVSDPPSDPYLQNNQAVTNLNGALNSQNFWRISVPANQQLTVTLSGGTGDADLYTNFGSRPSLTSYLCRPYVNGNNETCTVTQTQAGDYYVMLAGYSAYTGASLLAAYAPSAASTDPSMTTGRSVVNLAGAASSKRYWRIHTPAGANLTVQMSGGTGDADLYVRFGSRPTASGWNCRPYLVGNNETCSITSTKEGDYYVMVRGYSAYSGVNLTATY